MGTSKNFKKFSLAPLVIIIVVLVWGFVNYLNTKSPDGSPNLAGREAIAETTDNVSGYAWSESIGWISFNCTDQATCGDIDYGVNVDNLTGVFSGFAWSETIGWIKFDPAGPYPSDPPDDNHSVEINLSNDKVSGWARACAGAANPDCTGGTNPDSGGWDGWIKTRGTGPSYGVTYAPSTKELSDFAWGSDVVGWISFNCSNDHDPDTPGVQSVCETSDYKVIADINKAPSASSLSVTTGDYCSIPSHVFSWTFSDPDPGDSQASYELQADNNSDFLTPEVSVSGGSSPSHTVVVAVSPGANQLAYNTSYNWRVKVFDSQGADSGWISPNPSQSPFNTETHLYPDPVFTFSPSSPSQGEAILFSENTICYDINNNAIFCPADAGKYRWDFDFETPPFTEDAIGKTATTTYNDSDSHTVALEVTDQDTNTCRGTQDISPQRPLPKFRETAPGS